MKILHGEEKEQVWISWNLYWSRQVSYFHFMRLPFVFVERSDKYVYQVWSEEDLKGARRDILSNAVECLQVREAPLYQSCSFFNIAQNAFRP